MNVFVIYLNDTEGMVLVFANSKKKAMELFLTNETSPVHVNEINLEDVKVEVYPTQMQFDTDSEGIGEYCISANL